MANSQRGVVLVVGLVVVLLISIVSLSAIRGTGLQESMAGNMRDRNIAFQAAESAIRSGEAQIAPDITELPEFDVVAGFHRDLDTNPQNSVLFFSEADWTANAINAGISLEFVDSEPRYMVEEVELDIGAGAAAEGSAIDVGGMLTSGDAKPYRVSSRGVGATTGTEVVLQSSYKRRF